MREEEKETNTTPQNQVSLSLLKSVLWCSFLVALFCRGCGCGGTRVALVSLSLSSLLLRRTKNGTKGDLDRRDFFACLGF